MPIEAAAALTTIKQVDESLGIIGKFVAQLKAQPDLAALKLAAALDEIRKTWEVVDEAISSYLALGIDQDALAKHSKLLLQLGGGGLLVKVQEGRGHCSVIGHIYSIYLDRWFEKVFMGKNDELAMMCGVFSDLAYADQDVFREMEEIGKQLQAESTKALDLVLAGKEDEAQTRIRSSLKDLLLIQQSISQTLQKLFNLKTSFIEISRVA